MLFLKYQSIGENIKTQVDKVQGEDINNHIRWNFRLCVVMEPRKKKGIEDQHFEIIWKKSKGWLILNNAPLDVIIMEIYFTSLANAVHFWHEKHHKNIQWVLIKFGE
jgi:hypothetical protein